jgi:hypothetical protein
VAYLRGAYVTLAVEMLHKQSSFFYQETVCLILAMLRKNCLTLEILVTALNKFIVRGVGKNLHFPQILKR